MEKKSAAHAFFENRGIHIPGLNPRNWVDSLDENGPVAARFYYDYLGGRDWYESGSGRTRAIIESDRVLVFDLTGNGKHLNDLVDEAKVALEAVGERVIDLRDPEIRGINWSWPTNGMVGAIPVGSLLDSLWSGWLVACLPR